MSERESKTIIFAETKKKADELHRKLRREGYIIEFMISKPEYFL